MEYERQNILGNALMLFGYDAQIELAIEEMGELLVAINHHKRGRVDVSAVQEEIADVKIAMDQLAMIYGEEGVSEFEKKKLERLKNRIVIRLQESLWTKKKEQNKPIDSGRPTGRSNPHE